MAANANAKRATPMLDARKQGQPVTQDMLEAGAKDNMFLHFTQHQPFQKSPIPIIVKAEGHYFWDINGKR